MNLYPLKDFFDKNKITYYENVNSASLVSIKIGGIASIFVCPKTPNELCKIISFLHNKYKYVILGNGTNTYFCECYDGVIISTKQLNKICVQNNKIIAECGASLTGCAVCAYEASLTGLEFAYGIPGSVGGAVYMNARAFEGEIAYIIEKCNVYDIEKNIILTIYKNELDFSYKHSVFMDKKYVVLDAHIVLSKEDQSFVKNKMDSYWKKRTATQPLDLPNAGSAFKKPKNSFASKLIDEAGYKGMCFGGAQISTKHAGFIVNNGNATAEDVNNLISFVKKNIKNKFDVILEEEIIYVE